MRSLKTLILGAAAALAMGTSALATDLYVESPAYVEPEQETDWSGFYIGLLKGVSFASIPDCGSECDVSLPGIAKVIGYNWDTGDIIFGVDEMFVMSFWPYEAQYDEVRKFQWQKLFRIGVEVTDNTMIYGAAGGGIAYVFLDGNKDHEPYGAIAAGVEVMFNENAIWRTHVQYSRTRNFDPCSGCFIQAFSIATGVSWLL